MHLTFGTLAGAGLVMAASIGVWAVGPPARTQRPSASNDTCFVVGRVLTGEPDSAPVRRAVVTVSGGPLRSSASVLTDDAGRFAFDRLPADTVTLSASKPAYVAAEGGQASRTVVLAKGSVVTDVVLRLVHGAAITGIVSDLHGAPAAGILVTVVSAGPPGAAGAKASAVTDDRGTYRAFGLPAGNYLVAVEPRFTGAGGIAMLGDAGVEAALTQLQRSTVGRPGLGSEPPTPTPQASATGARPPTYMYAPIWYPGTTVAADAQPVTVGSGEERSGIDVPIQVVRRSIVSGTVVSGTGSLPSGVRIGQRTVGPALQSNAMVFDLMLNQHLGADGSFSMENLTPGRYQLLALAGPIDAGRGRAGVPPGSLSWAMFQVDVSGTDVSGVTLELHPAMHLTGRVVVEGATPAPDVTALRVQLMPLQKWTGMIAEFMSSVAPPAVVKADGTFEVQGVIPGRYTVTCVPPDTPTWSGWAMTSLSIGNQRVNDGQIDFSGSDVAGVVLTLSKGKSGAMSGLPAGQGRLPH